MSPLKAAINNVNSKQGIVAETEAMQSLECYGRRSENNADTGRVDKNS